MTHRKLNSRQAGWLAVAAGLTFAGCTPGQVSLTVNPTSGGSGAAVGSFALTTIQAAPPANFIVNASAVAFFNAASLPIVGTCGRGTSAIQISVNSVVQTATHTCPNVGNLSFTLTFPGDGLYSVVFTPLGADGSAITANALTQGIYVKTSLPPAPGVNTQGASPEGIPASGSSGSPYTVTVGPGTPNVAGTIVVNGTMSTAVSDYVAKVSEVAFGLGTMSYNLIAGTWSYTFTITQGQSVSLSFKDTDVVGNISGSTVISVATAGAMGIDMFGGAGLTSPLLVSGATPFYVGSHMSAFTAAPFLNVSTATSGNQLFSGVLLDDDEGP